MASSFLSFSAFVCTLTRKKPFSGYKNSTSSCRTVLSIIRSRHIRAAHCNGHPVSSPSSFIIRLWGQPFSQPFGSAFASSCARPSGCPPRGAFFPLWFRQPCWPVSWRWVISFTTSNYKVISSRPPLAYWRPCQPYGFSAVQLTGVHIGVMRG